MARTSLELATTGFDPVTGRVTLESTRGCQVVFRVTWEGIYVWCKVEKTERLFPWHQILGWVVLNGRPPATLLR